MENIQKTKIREIDFYLISRVFWPVSLKNMYSIYNLLSNVAKRLLKWDHPLQDRNLDYHWAAKSETSYKQSRNEKSKIRITQFFLHSAQFESL